ncbi:hypothetical protein EV360DRAFT_73784 [Lentinula raphanica]|nr:hypothetical protein EV360DRAFT_73784 [Lentinula raphanica]
MPHIESDTVSFADFVFVDYPSTNNPPSAHDPPTKPNLSVERLPLRGRHNSGFSNEIPAIHGGPLTTSVDDDTDDELCDHLPDCEDDSLTEEADLEPLAPPGAVVFASPFATMSGFTDYSAESYRNTPAKVVVARFSSRSATVWILIGPVHSVMPTAIIPAEHTHLDSVFSECKIQHQIFLVHDLSSVVEHVHTCLTMRFLSGEFQALCHALGSNNSATQAVPIVPDWKSWLSVIHEFKRL